MKNNILITLLFLTLFAPTGYSQKVLSLRLHPYGQSWTNSLTDLLKRSGFEVPVLSGNPVAGENVVHERNELQLDSTKTFTGFDANIPGGTTPVLRTWYKYMLPGVKIETNFQYENGAWQRINRTTFISDDQERLTEAHAEAFDPATQSFIPDSRLELYPHGDSPELLDSFFTYLWDSTILDWRIVFSNRNVFDGQDRLLETAASVDYFGDPVIFKEYYSYDGNGDNHLIEEFAILGSDVFPSSRTDLVYVDHRPIEVLVSGSDGVSFFPQYRSNYAYNLSGTMRKNMNFEWDGVDSTWFLYQTIDYSYDNQQRLARKETKDISQDAADKKTLITFSYIEGEDLLLEWYFYWDDDLFDWVLDTKKHYYYNGLTAVDPDPVAVQNLQVSPNPTADFASLNLDATALVQVFDTKGNMVSTGSYQPGYQLSLQELPSGLYFITARTENEVYAGKIIKE